MHNKTRGHKVLYYGICFVDFKLHGATLLCWPSCLLVRPTGACARLKREASSPPICRHAVWFRAKPLFVGVCRSEMTQVTKVLFPPPANICRRTNTPQLSGLQGQWGIGGACPGNWNALYRHRCRRGASTGLHVQGRVCAIQEHRVKRNTLQIRWWSFPVVFTWPYVFWK